MILQLNILESLVMFSFGSINLFHVCLHFISYLILHVFFTNNLIDLFPEEKSSDAGIDSSSSEPPNDPSNHVD